MHQGAGAQPVGAPCGGVGDPPNLSTGNSSLMPAEFSSALLTRLKQLGINTGVGNAQKGMIKLMSRAGKNSQECNRRAVTCKSAKAFFMDAVPLKATTTVLLPHPTRQRVSCPVSQKLWELVSRYRLRAVSKVRVVLAEKDALFSSVPCWSC